MGYLPKLLIRARSVKWPVCEQGKIHMTSSVTNYEISKRVTVMNHGDLVHMDQAESSTHGRPLTYSEHEHEHKIK